MSILQKNSGLPSLILHIFLLARGTYNMRVWCSPGHNLIDSQIKKQNLKSPCDKVQPLNSGHSSIQCTIELFHTTARQQTFQSTVHNQAISFHYDTGWSFHCVRVVISPRDREPAKRGVRAVRQPLMAPHNNLNLNWQAHTKLTAH